MATEYNLDLSVTAGRLRDDTGKPVSAVGSDGISEDSSGRRGILFICLSPTSPWPDG